MTQLPADGLGHRVAAYRKRNGWSAQRLADNTRGGVSRATIANLESGRRTDLGLRQFLAICLALRVPPTALLVDLEEPFEAAGAVFPGTAPAPLEPAAPVATLALWLDGRIATDTTPAARHAAHVRGQLEEYLAAIDAVEVADAHSRIATHSVRDDELVARRDDRAQALRDAGVHVP